MVALKATPPNVALAIHPAINLLVVIYPTATFGIQTISHVWHVLDLASV